MGTNEPPVGPRADAVEQVIHRRASALTIDRNRDVDPGILGRLALAAQAAPNHRRTRPLRIAFVRGDSRRRLGEAIADSMARRGDDPAKVDKTRTKYERSPVVVVVASAEGTSPTETEENRYAVAAGIQNMLLLAEELGLRALWGSPAKGANDAITALCGFDGGDHVIALVYLGWPIGDPPENARPAPVVRWLD